MCGMSAVMQQWCITPARNCVEYRLKFVQLATLVW
jgi:hypothetical protein